MSSCDRTSYLSDVVPKRHISLLLLKNYTFTCCCGGTSYLPVSAVELHFFLLLWMSITSSCRFVRTSWCRNYLIHRAFCCCNTPYFHVAEDALAKLLYLPQVLWRNFLLPFCGSGTSYLSVAMQNFIYPCCCGRTLCIRVAVYRISYLLLLCRNVMSPCCCGRKSYLPIV